MIAPALLMSALLFAAPRPPYGGDAVVVHGGGQVTTDPASAVDLADLTLAAALFDGLYRFDEGGEVVPAIAAGALERRGDRWILPLGDVAFHDGRRLTAAAAKAVVERWAAPGSRSAHLVLPIARDPSGALLIEALPAENGLSIGLAAAYPHWPRLLASVRAGIALGARGPVPLGSGPFRPSDPTPDGALLLLAFTEHQRGRPFLDSVTLLGVNADATPRARLGPGAPSLAIELPQPLGKPAPQRLPHMGGAAPTELIFLAVGSAAPELTSAAAVRSIDLAIVRDRLARRFLGSDARPAATLTGAPGRMPAAQAPPAAQRVRATMLVPRRRGLDRRFAERVQLDLLRAGVSVTIEVVDDDVLESKRSRGDFGLILDRVTLEGGAADDPIHHLHGLLWIAGDRGVVGAALTAEDLMTFAAASARDQAEMLVTIDRRIRDAARIVPIAHTSAEVWTDRSLAGVTRGPSGAVILEHAFFDPGAQR